MIRPHDQLESIYAPIRYLALLYFLYKFNLLNILKTYSQLQPANSVGNTVHRAGYKQGLGQGKGLGSEKELGSEKRLGSEKELRTWEEVELHILELMESHTLELMEHHGQAGGNCQYKHRDCKQKESEACIPPLLALACSLAYSRARTPERKKS